MQLDSRALLVFTGGLLLATTAAAADVIRFVLIDADADVPIVAFDPLLDGAVLDLTLLPTTHLNVRADVSEAVGSVRFSLDGVADYRTESATPYALEGDTGGDYAAWTPTVGRHDLTATPYVGTGGTGGTAGRALSITFVVIAGGNLPPTVSAGPDRFLRLPASATTLEGTADDLDGFVETWLWSQDSGPSAATLSGEDTPTPDVADLVEGSYVFRLTVTDDDGADASDTVTVALGSGDAIITGELRLWHRVTLSFAGPASAEEADPNPFRDYRLLVSFDHAASGEHFVVPGFFAGDGSAAETSATSGSQWRVHFTPDETGTWSYVASFRSGADISVDLDPAAGVATAFDGASGDFLIGPSDKTGRDFRARHGRLEYVGERYLRFAGSGEYFLKGGADSPENFLAYWEFDDTVDHGGAGHDLIDGLHRYAEHIDDWSDGDPTWKGGKGKGIIGALNYLAAAGGNSVYFLTMNASGDGREVYPWSSYDADHTRFDVSKLDQWEVVLNHHDSAGIQLHVLLQETENDQLLDGGALGLERKLYYREMVARFGHHLALEWNLGEETSRDRTEHEDDSEYLKALDPYDHPIVLHTFPGGQEAKYAPMLGWPHLDGPSIQIDGNGNTHARTLEWIERSAAAGHQWVVCLDEQGGANSGVVPDADDYWHDGMRRDVLWGNLIAGGAGVEWYFGYAYPHSDLDCEDWRTRAHMWELTRIARDDFFHRYLPFSTMDSADALVTGGAWALAAPDVVYAVYLKDGGTTSLDLTAARGTFEIRWFDPRNSGDLQVGSVATVTGGAVVLLGDPPAAPGEDWAILVRRPGALHRGVAASFDPGWRRTSLPLLAANDDETPPFPLSAASPGVSQDLVPPTAPLTLYRLLGAGDIPAGNVLRAAQPPTGEVTLRY